MTNISNPSAFPRPMSVSHGSISEHQYSASEQDGMTLRDWFAGMALQGLMANPAFATAFPEARSAGITPPRLAFEMADAMLKARAA